MPQVKLVKRRKQAKKIMTDLYYILNPIDITFGVIGFLSGIGTAIRIFRKRPLRNAGILLQVSLLIIKMADHYFSTHPEAKEKLNKKIVEQLQNINDNLKSYMNDRHKTIEDNFAG